MTDPPSSEAFSAINVIDGPVERPSRGRVWFAKVWCYHPRSPILALTGWTIRHPGEHLSFLVLPTKQRRVKLLSAVYIRRTETDPTGCALLVALNLHVEFVSFTD